MNASQVTSRQGQSNCERTDVELVASPAAARGESRLRTPRDAARSGARRRHARSETRARLRALAAEELRHGSTGLLQ
jgi:hypothetical protein